MSLDAMDASTLRIGGFVPFSTIDYPGHLAAVVFCQGCPWRCRYCHNVHLQPPRGPDEISWSRIVGLLARRRGLLDAVVFSGGEPTLQAALPAAMRAVKAMGYRIGLHTAGIYPKRLADVLPLVDWIGMDVKAALADYERVTATPSSASRALRSIDLVRASGIRCQFRTTVDPQVLTPDRLEALSSDLVRLGVRDHVLQPCR
jgi:pyruvate formate lyase activating enzyme